MFKATQTHTGQYKPYGDSFYKWDIETDLPEEEALEKCFDEFSSTIRRKVPPKAEWEANIRKGGPKSGDYGYYFAGFYSFEKTKTGYHFTYCRPFCD